MTLPSVACAAWPFRSWNWKRRHACAPPARRATDATPLLGLLLIQPPLLLRTRLPAWVWSVGLRTPSLTGSCVARTRRRSPSSPPWRASWPAAAARGPSWPGRPWAWRAPSWRPSSASCWRRPSLPFFLRAGELRLRRAVSGCMQTDTRFATSCDFCDSPRVPPACRPTHALTYTQHVVLHRVVP